jgi:transcriptional regulator
LGVVFRQLTIDSDDPAGVADGRRATQLSGIGRGAASARLWQDGAMYIAAVDATLGESEWRPFVESQGFGHLIASGRNRDVPVVVPTQFILDSDTILLHLAAPNPIFAAIAEQPRVLLSVAGDWAFIPSEWKAIGSEDPLAGIPTTYYAAAQLMGSATVDTDSAAIAAVLRKQLAVIQPGVPIADPELAHAAKLRSIRAITIAVEEVRAKFKYGGNVDSEHRQDVISRLVARAGQNDLAAAAHTARRDS